MTTSTDMAGEWAVERIPANDAGRAFYLAQYKPFRLAALKQDPQGKKTKMRNTETRCNAIAIHKYANE